MSQHLPALGGALLVALALVSTPAAPAQDAPAGAADGVEVQPRGPVHEAFARPTDAPARGPVVPTEPPPPVNELPPEQRPEGDAAQWIPGYWAWDDAAAKYLWVSGCWRVPPPGRQWVAGSWAKANGGWQWQPGFWAGDGRDAPRPVDAAPPATLENGPSAPAPDGDSYYTPGQWVFRDGGWVWQPGGWTKNPDGMVYVPPTYLPVESGSLYVPGYWDYPPEGRGLLFAPVCFAGSPWAGDPGWSYRPRYAVGLGGLLTALFARPAYGCYYFGNYFGPAARGGYVPWPTYARRSYDPLLTYYGWANRGTPGWHGSLAGLYAGRANGTLPAPAAGFSRPAAGAALDPALVRRHTVNFSRQVTASPVNTLQPVQPLDRLNGAHVRLTSTSPAELARRPAPQTRQSFSSPLTGQSQPPAPVARPQPGPPRSGNPVAQPGPVSSPLPVARPQPNPVSSPLPVARPQPNLPRVGNPVAPSPGPGGPRNPVATPSPVPSPSPVARPQPGLPRVGNPVAPSPPGPGGLRNPVAPPAPVPSPPPVARSLPNPARGSLPNPARVVPPVAQPSRAVPTGPGVPRPTLGPAQPPVTRPAPTPAPVTTRRPAAPPKPALPAARSVPAPARLSLPVTPPAPVRTAPPPPVPVARTLPSPAPARVQSPPAGRSGPAPVRVQSPPAGRPAPAPAARGPAGGRPGPRR